MLYRGLMPRDTLTREQIVSAAIDLLDADGLEGLNMRALGQRLGSAAPAVLWPGGSVRPPRRSTGTSAARTTSSRWPPTRCGARSLGPTRPRSAGGPRPPR